MLYLQALSCRHLTSHHTSFPNQTPQNIKIQLNEARDFATKRNFWPEPLIDYTNDTINSTQLNIIFYPQTMVTTSSLLKESVF